MKLTHLLELLLHEIAAGTMDANDEETHYWAGATGTELSAELVQAK